MKKYIQFLLITALILSIACTITDYYSESESSENKYAFIQSAENRETPHELILINSQNCIPENFDIELKETRNTEQVDERIYSFLEEMLSDAENEGFSPEITSGYRSKEKQQEIFDNSVKEYREAGYSLREAKQLTSEQVAKPGYSEHESGLAVDINSANGNSWELYGWLQNNCYRYGFIVRYPDGKEDITGIQYEPWHLRFVGKESAKYIYETGITLEEYLLQ